MSNDGFTASDEYLHPHPSSIANWNESWLLSFSATEGRLAGLFRVGLLPNQKRVWLWLMLVVDGNWLVIDEPRLPLSKVRYDSGLAFDDGELRFAYEPGVALERARFSANGVARWLSGETVGQLQVVSVDLSVTATGPCYDNELRIPTMASKGIPIGYTGRRFEQPVRVAGSVSVGGSTSEYSGYGQRDRSWGPRRWTSPFTLVDLHSDDLQLWFATGPDPNGGGIGYAVHHGTLEDLTTIAGHLSIYGDELDGGTLCIATETTGRVELNLEILSPPVRFQIAHSNPPLFEHFPYFRHLVRATRSDGGPPLTGWIEVNQFA